MRKCLREDCNNPIHAKGLCKLHKEESASEDLEVYTRIWQKRQHKCQICQVYLGNTLKRFHIDHLLEKSKYPELRHVEDNLILICFQCHEVKTNGFPKPKHKILINELLSKYTKNK